MPALIVAMLIVRPRAVTGGLLSMRRTLRQLSFFWPFCISSMKRLSGWKSSEVRLKRLWDNFEQRELRDTSGSAGYPQWMRVRGGLSDIWKVPIRVIALLYSPLVPYMIRSPGHLLGGLDAGLYLYLSLSIYQNRNCFRRNRPALVLLIVMLCFTCFSPLGFDFWHGYSAPCQDVTTSAIVAAGLPELRRQEKNILQLCQRNPRVRSSSKLIVFNYRP